MLLDNNLLPESHSDSSPAPPSPRKKRSYPPHKRSRSTCQVEVPPTKNFKGVPWRRSSTESKSSKQSSVGISEGVNPPTAVAKETTQDSSSSKTLNHDEDCNHHFASSSDKDADESGEGEDDDSTGRPPSTPPVSRKQPLRIHWTAQDRQKLEELVSKYGEDWEKIGRKMSKTSWGVQVAWAKAKRQSCGDDDTSTSSIVPGRGSVTATGTFRRWTEAEEKIVVMMRDQNHSWKAIGSRLHRSTNAAQMHYSTNIKGSELEREVLLSMKKSDEDMKDDSNNDMNNNGADVPQAEGCNVAKDITSTSMESNCRNCDSESDSSSPRSESPFPRRHPGSALPQESENWWNDLPISDEQRRSMELLVRKASGLLTEEERVQLDKYTKMKRLCIQQGFPF
ncbi:hypothetical protein T439DRAFT_354971 [Meredithblackwellia eburnea MCA 4105]